MPKKKSTDKDLIFSKILPSLSDNPFVDTAELEEMEEALDVSMEDYEESAEIKAPSIEITAENITIQVIEAKEPVVELEPEPTPEPEPEPEPLPEPEDLEPDILTALRSRLFARTETPTGSTHTTTNLMESLVLKYLDEVVDKFNLCKCDRCRCDVAAHALSNLNPKYIVGDSGYLNEIVEEIRNEEVLAALTRAALKVRMNPRH